MLFGGFRVFLPLFSWLQDASSFLSDHFTRRPVETFFFLVWSGREPAGFDQLGSSAGRGLFEP